MSAFNTTLNYTALIRVSKCCHLLVKSNDCCAKRFFLFFNHTKKMYSKNSPFIYILFLFHWPTSTSLGSLDQINDYIATRPYLRTIYKVLQTSVATFQLTIINIIIVYLPLLMMFIIKCYSNYYAIITNGCNTSVIN